MEKLIVDTLELIKEQIGMTLTPCPHFTGVKTYNGKEYFNVILPSRVYDPAAHRRSEQYRELESFAHHTGLIAIQPNGIDRVAIFPKPLKP